jgi:hypothetical protein
MQRISWRDGAFSVLIFGFVVVFFLFCVQQLISTDVGVWTTELTGTGNQEGPGGTLYTKIDVVEVGNVAVRVRLPKETRYEVGAPLVVFVPTFFTPDQKTFQELSGLSDYGFAQVSLLLPGHRDRETDLASDGEVDYGGALSVAALRDALLYAAGEKADVDGKYIQDRTTVDLDTDVVGAYAFSHPGILLFQTIAQYGDVLPLDFVVGRENATEPLISSLEIGHFEKGEGILNTLYDPATDYHDDGITLSYETIAWDTHDERPYFDVNGDGLAKEDDDILFGTQIPGMFDKKMYSPELLQALWVNELFTDATWPEDLATPEEAVAWWEGRESLAVFDDVGVKMPDLHVMLVFGKKDHVQPAADKPHIRQAYAGLTNAGVWVRLNPDAAYVAAFDDQLADDYDEHPAGTGPSWWEGEVIDWAHADGAGALRVVPLAAICEMADRAATGVWEGDLYRTVSPDEE